MAAALLSTGLVVAAATPAAAAATLHVPEDHATIGAAIAAAASGDTIEVGPGTYHEKPTFTSKVLHLVGTGGPSVTTIDADGTGGAVRMRTGSSLTGFTVTRAESSLGGHGRAVTVEGTGEGTVIRGNRFVGNRGSRGTIEVLEGSTTIDRNSFEGNVCEGSTEPETLAVVAAGVFSEVTVSNNLFLDNSCHSAVFMDTGGAAAVVNNSILGRTVGLRVGGIGATPVTVRNNLITGAEVGVWTSPGRGLFENNLVGNNTVAYQGIADQAGSNGNLGGDPGLINVAARDMRLRADSAAVDAGSSTGAPAEDFTGSPRPVDGPDDDADAEFDIGAFERSGSEPPAVDQRGTIDRSWSGDGMHTLPTPYYVAMAPQGSDGLFTAFFSQHVSSSQFRVTKLGASGAPSPDFGSNGSVLRGFTSGGHSLPSHLEPSGANLVAVGEHHGALARLGVTRLLPDGGYDPSFSGDGRATYKVFKAEHDLITAFRVTVLANGKIAMAVAALDYDANGRLQLTGQTLLRLNANGTADTSYSGDAKLPLTKDYSDVAFLPTGAAYAGRKVGSVHEVRKLTPGGYVDRSFSGDGIVSVNCSPHLGANLTADPTGRPTLMCVRTLSGTLNLGIFRFTTSGAVDTSYSGDGKTAMVLTGGSASGGWALLFDDAGLPWAAIRSATDAKRFLVHTLDANGSPNTAFSGDGKATIALPSTVDLGALEKGPDRLYVEDYPSASAARLTAVAT